MMDLKKLIENHPGALENRENLRGFLTDLYSGNENKLYVNLLIMAFDLDIVNQISTNTVDSLFVSRFTKLIVDTYGTNENKAEWAVLEWCKAYGYNIKPAKSAPKAPKKKTTKTTAAAKPKTPSPKNNSGDYIINNGVLEKYTGSNSVVVIPSGVTRIGESAFFACRSLKTITIPSCITSIGDYAFFGCSSLKSITLPDSVTSIGMDAFFDCDSLKTVTIPRRVTNIEEGAFSCCGSLESLSVDKNNQVYYDCGDCIIEKKTKTLILGCKNSIIPKDGSVTSIGNHSFAGCSLLKSIAIPDSVTVIGKWAFCGSKFQTSFTIPKSVTKIGSGAFSGCSSLERLSVDKNNQVYYDCGNCIVERKSKTVICGFENSIIPKDGSVTRIGAWAFSYCGLLESITIPDSITAIDAYAFYECESLESITLPRSVINIAETAFENCEYLTIITPSDSYAEKYAQRNEIYYYNI